MENQRIPPNHLVNRLYKNFSQSKLSQKSLIAKDLSSINDSSSFKQRNILVPIFQSNQRQSSLRKSTLIDDKKLQDISIIAKTQSIHLTHKNRFNKMILEDSKILDDEVAQNQHNVHKLKNKLKENKGRIFKKRAIIRSSNKGDYFGVEDKDLTLTDFLNLLKQEPDMADEFVYLKIVSHPYDLKIVDYDNKSIESSINQKASVFNKKTPLPSTPSNQHDRITVSARGITYLNEDQPVFVTIEQWQKQAELYNKLTKLSFFKQYRVWKNFCVWKRYIRRINMKKVSETLSRELLFADKHIRPSLIYSKSLLLRLESVKLCKIDESQKQVPTYSEFKEQQNRFRTEDLPHNINYIQQQILNNVLNACKLSLKSFKQQNRIGSTQSGSSKTEPLLIGDNSNKPMPYTEQATVKTHYQKLTKFMKLIDSLIIDGKLKLIFESMTSLRQTFCLQNDEYYTDVIATNQKLMYKGHQWFFCQIFFERNRLVFDPNLSKMQLVFEELINKGITHICKKHKSIRTSDVLVPFISVQEQKMDLIEDIFNLEEIVRTNDVFVGEYAEIIKEIERSFSFVENYSKRLLPFLEIYKNNSNQNLESYKDKDPQIIQKYIEKWKGEDLELNRIVEQHESSMLSIQTQRLKQTVKSCASVCLEHIYKMLPEMLRSKFQSLRTKLRKYKELVDNKPENVQEFILLNQNVNRINQELDDLSINLSEVSFIFNIIKNNKSAMGESMQTLKSKENKLNELNQLMVSLRGKIDQATMKMNTLKVQFLEQINKISPQINSKVQENYSEIISFEYKNSSIQQIVQFLESKQISLSQIFELNKKLNYYQKNLQTEETSSEILNKYEEYFNRIFKIWSYKQRMNQFSTIIKSSKLNTLDVEAEWIRFQNLLIDIETLSKQCIVEQQSTDYQLNSNDKSVIFQLQQQIVSYTPVMKSIKAMKSQILKQKQWEEIKSHFQSNNIECQIINKIRNSEITLEAILTNNIQKHSKFLTEVTIKANHQAELVVILQRISQFWTSNYIQSNLYMDYKDVYKLESNLELFSKIDENLVELNIVKSSKYVDTVLAETEKQTKLFSNLQEVLTQWRQYQNNWLMLESLLNNSYFKGYPKQMKAFTMADNAWRKIVKMSRQHPVKRWAEQQSILQTLKNNQAVFTNIKKLIPEFLHKKREMFPRFYMVSDEQLITLISECKDFRSTQPHLWKIFPAIQRFDYSSGDKQFQPTGLVNFDGETIPLKMIRVGVQAQQIFKMLQDAMKQSIKSLIKSSLSAIQKQSFKRKDWIKQNPFQVVHFVDMLEWTRMVENDYLNPDTTQDLSNLYYAQHLQLNQTIQLLNDPNRKISQKVLNSLLIQNIQYRDAVQKLIVESVETVNDFNWTIQIKSYYQNETFVLKQVEDQIAYGYEFLRVFSKLPICPQTQKSRLGLFKLVHDEETIVLNGHTSAFEDIANISGKNLIKIGSQINKQSLQSLIIGSYLSSSWLLFANTLSTAEKISQIATIINLVRVQNTQRQNSQRFKESAFAIHIQKAQQMPISIRDNLRSMSFVSPDQWFIVEIQLYRQGLIWSKEFMKELKPLIQKVENSLEINVDVSKLSDFYKKLQINSQWQNDQVLINILSATRNHIVSQYKVDEAQINAIFNGYLSTKNVAVQNYVKPTEIAFSLKSQNIFEMKSGAETLDWIVSQYTNVFSQEIKKQNMMFVNSKINSKDQLFGYQTSNGTWINGSIQTFLFSNQNQKWIVIEQPSQQIRNILDLSLKQGIVYFSNLTKYKIPEDSLKLFYVSSQTPSQNVPLIKQHSLQHKIQTFITKHQSTIKPYYLQLFKEYYIKTIATLTRSFKDLIQLPHHKQIIDQFTRVTQSFLNSQPQTIEINDRGLQKLFSWCLFITLSNRVNLESHIFDKFCKIYQDCIKFEHIKVTNLSEYMLQFPVPEGTFRQIQDDSKFILNSICHKVELMKMFIKSNESLILLGSQGSLKSTSINELIESSPKDHKFIHYFASSTMKLSSFINFILNQMDLRKYNQQFILQPKGFNNSKLSIFVDNVNSNQEIFNFIQWFSKDQYKRLWVSTENRYIKVSTKLTVSAIVSGRTVIDSLKIRNLLPINFNIDVEDTLLHHYSQQFKDRVQSNLLDSLIQLTEQTIKAIKNLNPLRKYTSHHLSRFFLSLSYSSNVSKEQWINKFAFVYTSELLQGKKAIIDCIYKRFNLGVKLYEPSTMTQENNLDVCSIRIVDKAWEFKDRYQYLQGYNDKLVRYENKKQIQRLTQSENNYQIYFALTKQNYSEEFEIINQLSHNSPEFILIVDLQSQHLLNELYLKYSSTIDKSFVIIYCYSQTNTQHNSTLEEAFNYFKNKIRLNKNNHQLLSTYYEQILSKNKQGHLNKISAIQKIITDYTSFKDHQQRVIKQCNQKSEQVKQRYTKQQWLFAEIKDLNMKLTGLKKQIQQKNHQKEELPEAEEENQVAEKLKEQITDLEKRIVFMSKQLASKEEQVQMNTKTKDILKSQINMLNETIQDFEEIFKDLDKIIERIKEQLIENHYILQNRIQSQSLKESLEIAYLSKYSQSKRKYLLQDFKEQFFPSSSEKLIQNYIFTSGQICCIYDPNRSAAKTITKLYSQQVVIVTNIQKLPQITPQKYLMMYIRQPDRLLSYFIQTLRSINPAKIILILDYVSQRYSCLNFETSFNYNSLEELIMISFDQYLKETIHGSVLKVQNLNKNIRNKEEEIQRIISNGIHLDKTDYLKLLMGKLHQLSNFKGAVKDQENELSRYIAEKQKYGKLSKLLEKFVKFVEYYLIKINKVYEYSSHYISKMISNSLNSVERGQNFSGQEYLDKIIHHIFEILSSSVRKQHLTIAQFAWCLVKIDVPSAAIDIMLNQYTPEQSYQQNIMSKFDLSCNSIDITTLRTLRNILDLKTKRDSSVIFHIQKFITSYLSPIQRLILPESNIFLVQRSSNEAIVDQFFPQSPYKIILSLGGLDKIDQCLSSTNSTNLLIVCQAEQSKQQNLFLKLIEIEKSTEKEHKIIISTPHYQNVSPQILIYCSKISFNYNNALLVKITKNPKIQNIMNQQSFSSLNPLRKANSISFKILFNIIEKYCLDYKLDEIKQIEKYLDSALLSIDQLDISNKWIIINAINNMSCSRQNKQILKIMFFKTYQETFAVLNSQQKQTLAESFVSKMVDYCESITIDTFVISQSHLEKIKRQSSECAYVNISYSKLHSISKANGLLSQLKLFPLVQIQEQNHQYQANSIQELLISEINQFNEYLMTINNHISSFNSFLSNKQSPNKQLKSIISSLKSNIVPCQWLRSKREQNVEEFILFINHKTQYLSYLKDNQFKIKYLSLSYLQQPKKILKKLIQLQQKKIKSQYKVLYGKLIFTQNLQHSHIGNNDSGILLNNLKMRYCKYDQQKSALENSIEKTNGGCSVLLVWGQMPSNVTYQKIPLYHQDMSQKDDIIMSIDIPFRVRTEMYYTETPSLLAENQE